MESGLEDRNNRPSGLAHDANTIVSMESGLEDRNNESVTAPCLTFSIVSQWSPA